MQCVTGTVTENVTTALTSQNISITIVILPDTFITEHNTYSNKEVVP